MKKNCDVIKDLLPLYIDDACSENSKELILKHLKTCHDCQNYLDSIKMNVGETNTIEIKAFKKFNKKIILKLAVIIIIFCALILALLWGINNYKFSMKYDKDMSFYSGGNGNRWNLVFNYTHDGYPYADFVKMNENGETIYVIFVTWKSTLHEYFSNINIGSAPDMDYGSMNIDNDIIRVYYTQDDVHKVKEASKEELDKMIKNSVYVFNNDKKTTNMQCKLGNEDYNYTMTYYDLNGLILESFGDNTIPSKLKLDDYASKYGKETKFENLAHSNENAHDVLDKIEKYIRKNGGNCSRKDN